jgi:ribonuclease T2
MKRLLAFAAIGLLGASAPAADFSYYTLALSYAPEFCAHAGVKDPRECGPGRRAFVVHGLWPQNDTGRGPEKCAPARPVAADLVRAMLKYMPTEALIQHEWATHGTCSGLSAADYFKAVRRTADSLSIPTEWQQSRAPIVVTPQEIEIQFGRANAGVPLDSVRIACYPDGGLQEIRVCFDKNFAPRPCTGVQECTKAGIRLSPAR